MFEDSYRAKGLRKVLVENLIKKGIKNKQVLEAIAAVPRHYFLESAFFEHAYEDKAFPIAEGQTISQPYTVARQTELLEIKPNDKVLEIGTGSGYQAAILCAMHAQVFSVEVHANLLDNAAKILSVLGYSPHLKLGDGTLGWPEYAPFDKILVTAGAPSVPEALLQQLKVGGILVIPVGNRNLQHMVRIVRTGPSEYKREDHGTFAFVPLVGEQGW